MRYLILILIFSLYTCNKNEKKAVDNTYYFDIYSPNDPENKSGTTTEKKETDFSSFNKIFRSMNWESYPANPTISVYNKNTILWVALYATSQDDQALQMFLIGHHSNSNASSTHFTIGKKQVLSLFKMYFYENNSEKIAEKLQELDEQFKEETKSK